MKRKIVSMLVFILLFGGVFGASNAFADVTLYTPYTGLSVTPGETIDYSVNINNTSSSIENVTFAVEDLPDGWTSTITSGGQDIRQLSIEGNGSQTIDVEITVPLQVEKGEYQFDLVANGNGDSESTLPFLVEVAEQGTFETELTSDQPNLEGHADASFSYTVDLKNRTANEQNYSLNAGAPNGWRVQFQSGGDNVTSVTVEPGGSKSITVDVTPPENVTADTYEIPIQAATSNTSADTTLEAVITGTYEVELSTPDGNLSTDITAGRSKTIDLVVTNTGTTTLTDVEITASTPPNWESEFDTSTIAELEAGSSKTIKATLTAPDDAIAGDYVTTFSSETAEASSDATFRVSVETSTLWGLIGVVIIIAVLGGLYYLFRKYGRR